MSKIHKFLKFSSFHQWFIIIITIITIVTAEPEPSSSSSVERVNCRRVVFHPYCRGISAKRSSSLREEPNIETIKESLPKIWQQILMPNIRYKIIERFNSEKSIPQTMNAVIINDDVNNIDDESTMVLGPKNKMLSEDNNHDDDNFDKFKTSKRSDIFDDEQVNSSKKMKRNKSIMNNKHNFDEQTFRIKTIPYHEFMKFFSQIAA